MNDVMASRHRLFELLVYITNSDNVNLCFIVEVFLCAFAKANYYKNPNNITTAITIIMAFSTNVASVIGSFKAVPRQAH